MDPVTFASALGTLISVGLKASKARDVEGVGGEELEALKSVFDAGGVVSRLRSKREPRPGALQLALISQAFGFALARHWAGSTAMVPEKSLLPDRVAKLWKGDEHARREAIEQRTQFAELRLREPGNAEAGLGELELVRALAGLPDATPYYRALWAAFTNPALSEPGEDPPLDLGRPGAEAEFRRHFRLAYTELEATPHGREVREWLQGLVRELPELMHDVLATSLATWGSRHVFGNVQAQGASGPLPFMSLDDTYVEPAGRLARPDGRIDHTDPGQPIQGLIRALLESHLLVVVSADFGHGKSLSARRLACDLANAYLEPDGHGRDAQYPVFVKCVRDIRESYSHERVIRTALWNTARESIGEVARLDFDGFAPPSAEQRTLYILDGLDELAFGQGQLEALFVHLREALDTRHRAIVLTRPGALWPNCLPKGTPRIDLLAFDDARIDAWLERWSGLPSQRAITRAQIPANLQELARTPILLLMIATTWTPDAQTKGRAALYEKFFYHIAHGKHEGDPDPHEAIESASARLLEHLRKSVLEPDETDPTQAMLWMMSRIAWQGYVLAQRSEVLQTRHVANILEDELGLPGDSAPQIRAGLLVALQHNPAGGSANILFGHQSFQEFLVARFWCSELKRRVGTQDMTLENVLMQGRLLQHENRAFEFLREMLGALEARTRQRIEDWAEQKVHDEKLEVHRFREDRTNYLRESALAIGSAVAEHGLRLRDPTALRSLFAWFHMMCLSPIIYAPGLHARLVNFRSEQLQLAFLHAADLQQANLAGANLEGASLAEANLAAAILFGASLTHAHLQMGNFVGALLLAANLAGANLEGANLTSANLERANLTAAELAGANLAGANLAWANLSGANLSGVNLAGANLDHVRGLTAAQLRSAKNYLLLDLEAREAAELASAEAPTPSAPDHAS